MLGWSVWARYGLLFAIFATATFRFLDPRKFLKENRMSIAGVDVTFGVLVILFATFVFTEITRLR